MVRMRGWGWGSQRGTQPPGAKPSWFPGPGLGPCTPTPSNVPRFGAGGPAGSRQCPPRGQECVEGVEPPWESGKGPPSPSSVQTLTLPPECCQPPVNTMSQTVVSQPKSPVLRPPPKCLCLQKLDPAQAASPAGLLVVSSPHPSAAWVGGPRTGGSRGGAAAGSGLVSVCTQAVGLGLRAWGCPGGWEGPLLAGPSDPGGPWRSQ